jgi:hypothetical protein
MPQEDDGAGKMHRADQVFQRVFPAYGKSAAVLEPREETFYLPASAIATESILGMVLSVATMGSAHLHSSLGQFPIEPVEIIGVVPDEASQGFGDDDLCQGLLDQGYLVRRSRFCTNGDRKTTAICHCHDLGPFATLGLPTPGLTLRFERGRLCDFRV